DLARIAVAGTDVGRRVRLDAAPAARRHDEGAMLAVVAAQPLGAGPVAGALVEHVREVWVVAGPREPQRRQQYKPPRSSDLHQNLPTSRAPLGCVATGKGWLSGAGRR